MCSDDKLKEKKKPLKRKGDRKRERNRGDENG